MGKKLAKKLDKVFVDLDAEIEREQGKTISEIFEREGEEAFRQLERDKVLSIKSDQNLVVSTGGGTPCFFDNMSVLNKVGRTVYLKLSSEQTLSRVRDGIKQRPLLADKSERELLEFIKTSVERRAEFYEQSDLIIDAFSLTNSRLVDLLI